MDWAIRTSIVGCNLVIIVITEAITEETMTKLGNKGIIGIN